MPTSCKEGGSDATDHKVNGVNKNEVPGVNMEMNQLNKTDENSTKDINNKRKIPGAR